MKPAVLIFKFFASLKLALFLLVSLALLFALGTFAESAYGTEVAKLMVYRSPWLSLLLLLLALNVSAAALDRLPWKKKHVGFVVTHTGILLVLFGSLVTRAYGLEGQMAIQEGQTAGRIILNEARIQLFSQEEGPLASLQIRERPFSWKGREKLYDKGLNIWLLRYYPKASREEKIEASSNGPAALQVVLESSWMKVSPWLLLDDTERGHLLLGPAALRFTREPLSSLQASDEEGHLEFQFENTFVAIPLAGNVSKKIPLEGTPYEVTILRILKEAVVEEGGLVERSEEWKNPACELILEGKHLGVPFREKHTVFSKFPDFSTLHPAPQETTGVSPWRNVQNFPKGNNLDAMAVKPWSGVHGRRPSQTGVRIYYHREEDRGPRPQNELRFIWQKGTLPFYQIRKGDTVTEGTLRLGEEKETGWMDFKFRIEQYYLHARRTSEFKEEPVSSEAEEHLSAIQIELEAGKERKSLWFGQGDRERVELGGRSFELLYGLRTQPIGFQISLRDFRVANYPGTNRPASFESNVTLKDPFTHKVRDVTIRMNQPLQYRGFKVFQSGYQQPERGPEVSIFTVAQDPGIPLKYAGAVVLISGILLMFYTRQFSNRPESVVGANRRVPTSSVPSLRGR